MNVEPEASGEVLGRGKTPLWARRVRREEVKVRGELWVILSCEVTLGDGSNQALQVATWRLLCL